MEKARPRQSPGVLFVCLGNSCRSIMAEAVARAHFPPAIRVGSAGLQPLGFVAAETLQVLAEAGLPTSRLRSKGLEEVNPRDFTLLVNLTVSPLEALLPWPFGGRILHHPVPDPFGAPLAVYRQVLEQLRRFIVEELPGWLAGPWEGPEAEVTRSSPQGT